MADNSIKASWLMLYAALVGVWPVNGGWVFNARLGVAIWDMGYTQQGIRCFGD